MIISTLLTILIAPLVSRGSDDEFICRFYAGYHFMGQIQDVDGKLVAFLPEKDARGKDQYPLLEDDQWATDEYPKYTNQRLIYTVHNGGEAFCKKIQLISAKPISNYKKIKEVITSIHNKQNEFNKIIANTDKPTDHVRDWAVQIFDYLYVIEQILNKQVGSKMRNHILGDSFLASLEAISYATLLLGLDNALQSRSLDEVIKLTDSFQIPVSEFQRQIELFTLKNIDVMSPYNALAYATLFFQMEFALNY